MFPKQLLTKIGISSILLLAGSLLSPASATEVPNYIEGTDKAAAVFNPLQVNNFQMQMSDSDFNSLTYGNVNSNNEGPWRRTVMSFTMADKVYGPYTVGVHLKGAWGSWRDINSKAAFKIKMDAFVKNQRLFGITKFTLNNMVQDPSYIHEAVTYRLFRAMDVPAARVGYANVTLNGRYFGLHLNVETVDTTMLSRWGIVNEHLYKGGVPDFPDFYTNDQWKFQVEDGSTTNKSDLDNFIRVNQKYGDDWWAEITQYADIKEIMTDFAVEAFVGHWDGYPFNHNNFFITFDGAGYAHMIPWGTDQTWGSGIDYWGSGTLLVQRCLSSNDCREMYLQILADIARKARSLELSTMAAHVAEAITADVIADYNAPFFWGPGIETANAYQSWAMGDMNQQTDYLSSLTSAWDTGVSEINVEGISYPVNETILLPVGSRQVEVQAIPFQTFATGETLTISSLKSGINFAEVPVTSADGQHTTKSIVSLYVLTKRSTSAPLSFVQNKSAVTKAGASKLSQLKSKLKKSKELTLKFSMPKAQKMSWASAVALLDKRASLVVNSMRASGIRVVKFTKVVTPKGDPNSIILSLKYQN